MSSAWLALIESNTSGTGRLFARRAAERGVRPILLCSDPARYKYAEEDHLDILQTDTLDERSLLRTCKDLSLKTGLVGITSSSEYFIASAARLAAELNLPGPSPAAVLACRDKQKQRLRLQAAGIGIPEFRSAASGKEAVAVARSLGFPVVVKPVSGSGSVGVKLCISDNEVAGHARKLLRTRRNERGMSIPRRILIEQLVSGDEYSVEIIGREVVGITRKHLGPLPHFVETGHDFPAVLDSEVTGRIRQTTLRALESLGLGWGPAHLELRVAADEIKVIEVNPRLAGGYIPELVRLTTGIDLISATISQVIGEGIKLDRAFERYASIRFLVSQQDGFLAEINGLDAARMIPDIAEVRIYSRPGDRVTAHGDFRDRIGHVIAVNDEAVGASEASELALSLIQPVTRPDAAGHVQRV